MSLPLFLDAWWCVMYVFLLLSSVCAGGWDAFERKGERERQCVHSGITNTLQANEAWIFYSLSVCVFLNTTLTPTTSTAIFQCQFCPSFFFLSHFFLRKFVTASRVLCFCTMDTFVGKKNYFRVNRICMRVDGDFKTIMLSASTLVRCMRPKTCRHSFFARYFSLIFLFNLFLPPFHKFSLNS